MDLWQQGSDMVQTLEVAALTVVKTKSSETDIGTYHAAHPLPPTPQQKKSQIFLLF